jgi:hypothetical protein
MPPWALGWTDAAPFGPPAGSCTSEGPVEASEDWVTEARYWSAPSFVIWVT